MKVGCLGIVTATLAALLGALVGWLPGDRPAEGYVLRVGSAEPYAVDWPGSTATEEFEAVGEAGYRDHRVPAKAIDPDGGPGTISVYRTGAWVAGDGSSMDAVLFAEGEYRACDADEREVLIGYDPSVDEEGAWMHNLCGLHRLF